MIDHLMYKNFLKNTTSVITNEQKSKKFEKQFSRWLYIFIKEKQSTQWNAWQQHLHTMHTAQFYRHNLYTVKLQAWQIHYHISTEIGLVSWPIMFKSFLKFWHDLKTSQSSGKKRMWAVR